MLDGNLGSLLYGDVSVMLIFFDIFFLLLEQKGGRGDSVVERRTPEREIQGSNPTTAV